MPIRITRLESPSTDALSRILSTLSENGRLYSGEGEWTPDVLAALPDSRQIFIARDSENPLGILVLVPGFLEAWGAPTDLLGGNPILPMSNEAAAIHTALLLEASAWVERGGHAGFEILLPMGAANLVRDGRLDAFFGRLGFARFYFAMTRRLDLLPACEAGDAELEIAPAAALTPSELYANYVACTAHQEIELVARQTSEERRAYFDSLADETLAHPASLALFRGDCLLGFTLAADWNETASHLAWIGVLPEERSKGLGRRLLCDATATCRDRGSERMSLYTDVAVSAKSLYGALGFEPAGALTYRWRCRPT